jgi:hypothetical protein
VILLGGVLWASVMHFIARLVGARRLGADFMGLTPRAEILGAPSEKLKYRPFLV